MREAGIFHMSLAKTIRGLLFLMQEAICVDVDLAAKFKEITFRDLPAACYPTAEATKALARSKGKLRRQNVARSFPATAVT